MSISPSASGNTAVCIAGPALLELHRRVLSEVEGIVRGVLRDTGLRGDFPGIDPDGCEVYMRLHHQSPITAMKS